MGVQLGMPVHRRGYKILTLSCIGGAHTTLKGYNGMAVLKAGLTVALEGSVTPYEVQLLERRDACPDVLSCIA